MELELQRLGLALLAQQEKQEAQELKLDNYTKLLLQECEKINIIHERLKHLEQLQVEWAKYFGSSKVES
eukprot:4326677-Lingulodinium_polyedra.AAC.1